MNQNNDICLLKNIELINENVASACKNISKSASDIIIMAVTKNASISAINTVINGGVSYIGENRVQEFLEKYEHYNISKSNIHFIGHLQTNKVKYIIDKVSMIESVDSIKLALEIDRLSFQNGIIMDILIEVNIMDEPSKSGFSKLTVFDAVHEISRLQNVKIKGIMCVPPKENCIDALALMQEIFVKIKECGIENVDMQYLSTGMSQCYADAITYGSNIIRLGSALFK